MTTPACLGILGGAGPLATAHVYRRFLERWCTTHAAVDDHAFPRVVVHQEPALSLTSHGAFRGDAPQDVLAHALDRLVADGADVIVIACNTWHQALPAGPWRWPVVSLIDTAARACAATGTRRVMVLESSSNAEHGLYAQALRQAGVRPRLVPDTWAGAVHRLIESGMKGVLDPSHVALADGLLRLAHDQALGLLIGCTELSWVFSQPAVQTLPDPDGWLRVDAVETTLDHLMHHPFLRSAVADRPAKPVFPAVPKAEINRADNWPMAHGPASSREAPPVARMA